LELELKYSLSSEQAFQQLLEATALGAFRLEPVETLEVYDRYLDTADQALLKAGYACRLRREYDSSRRREDARLPRGDGGRYLATVKGQGDARGAFHQRLEHEVTLPEPLPPEDWPPGPARDLVLGLCREHPLLPLFDATQERYRRCVYDRDRAVAMLSLDRVQFYSGREVRGSALELEAELLPDGRRQDLDYLAAELDRHEGLVPQPQSKFARGLSLAQTRPPERGTRWGNEPTFVEPGATEDLSFLEKPQKPFLDPDDLMSEAGRKTLRYHFQEMVYHEPGTRLGEDAEALHDMRVATRRMRAAFRVFGEFFEPRAVAPYLKGLRRTGRALGPVRDADVLQEKALAYLASLPELGRGGLESLFQAIEQHREAARERMLRYLDGKKYAQFRERFGRFVEAEHMGSVPIGLVGGEPRPLRVRHVVPMVAYERLAAVRAYDEWVRVPDPPLERLHALRIACKRLRYTLEFFQGVLGPDTEAAIKQVVAVQDHLGALQDAVVASAILREFLTTGSWGKEALREVPPSAVTPNPGVEAYLAARQAEMQHLVGTFPQVWQQITHSDFSQLMAGAIGVL
jgi:CHAD domain-containing protein